MIQKTVRERLLASTMICGAFALALGAAPAVAQTQPMGQGAQTQGTGTDPREGTRNSQTETAPIEATPDEQRDQNSMGETPETEEQGEVVVTGSRIPRPELTSVSPVTVLGSAEVDLTGTTRVEDLVNNLPQAFAAQNAFINNGATGTATVDLRNLGAARTLVLVDGRRLQPGTPNAISANGAAPDLNFIPAALVDRVEVLTGGASAVYGADAVAGVVNFIMDKDFEGVRLEAQYSFFQHQNENDFISGIVAARGASAVNPGEFQVPPENFDGGYQKDLTFVMGVNTPDRRGNITAYAGYRNIDPILQRDFDFSACSLTGTGETFICGGSSTGAPGRFTALVGPNRGRSFTLDPAGGGNTFRPFVGARDQFNFAPFNYFQRPDERYVLGAFGNYELNPRAEFYTQLMFMDDRTVSQLAPSGFFFGAPLVVNCDNPFLSTQQATTLGCGVATDPDPRTAGNQALVPLYLGRRNVEGGARIDDLRHTSYRGVIGLRGELGMGFNYEVVGQHGVVNFREVFLNEFSTTRFQQALLAVRGPAGQPVCQLNNSQLPAGTQPLIGEGCAPYNPFQIGGVTQAALNYVQVPGLASGQTSQSVVTASVAGTLEQVRSPLAASGVGIALGTEYRRDAIERQPDLAFASGDLTGQGGPTLPIAGDVEVYELFGEARIPLAEDRPFFQDLSLELGYRFSDFNTGVQTQTYKVAGDWTPFDGFRFRGGYNRAVRAPNIIELFAQQQVALFGGEDPCAGPNPQAANPLATPANCARTGVTAGQYGNIIECPADQCNQFIGGNPNLRPEEADTITAGLVFQPTFLRGASLTVDYFNIKVEGLVGTVGAQLSLNQCLSTGNPFFCGNIQRAPGSGIIFGGGGAGRVVNLNTNVGALETTGVDVQATYRADLADFGLARLGSSLSFNYVATFLDELVTQPLPTPGTFDCAGLYGNNCGTPSPTYRHKLRVTLNTPFDIQISGQWRYFSSVELDSAQENEFLTNPGSFSTLEEELEEQSFFDLTANWNIRDQVTLRAGVNNIFDDDPPVTSEGPTSGNTFPQVYDIGRYIFTGITVDF